MGGRIRERGEEDQPASRKRRSSRTCGRKAPDIALQVDHIHPVALGGGTRYFPPLTRNLDLRLAESKNVNSRVVYLRYERTRR